jgi:Tfp pilus assembly protein PilN
MKAVNLIPADQHSRASVPTGRSGGGAYIVLGLLVGLALLALLYGTAAHQISSNRKLYASLTARTAQAQARAAQLTPYTSFVALREQRVQAVTQLVDSRFDWANSLYELGRVLPAGASIGSLEGEVGTASGTSASSSSTSSSSASVTSATPPGSIPSFTLVGCATSQSEVATTLERLRLIDGVDEVQLQSAAKSGAGGGGGGSGCGGNDVSFTVRVSFDALPAAPSTSGSAQTTVASTSTSTSSSPAPSSSSTASTSSSAPASTPSKAPASTGAQEPAQ